MHYCFNVICTLCCNFEVELFVLFVQNLVENGGHIRLSERRLPPTDIHGHDVRIAEGLEIRAESCLLHLQMCSVNKLMNHTHTHTPFGSTQRDYCGQI